KSKTHDVMYTRLLNVLQVSLCFLVLSPIFVAVGHVDHDHLLCRKCGNEVTENYIENFINITSTQSEQVKIVALYGHSNVTVQTLRNPANNVFELVTLKVAGCTGVGKWYSEHTWFPDYSWKVCVCPRCKAHLGWVFEPSTRALAEPSQSKASSEGFYALILGRLISEDFSDSLVIGLPKIHQY
ncbi:hypothetical protein SK128_017944, partial [Halocaridina rubra]